MRRIVLITACTALLLSAWASPALADLTGFLAVSPTPAKHVGQGFAIGAGLVIVGFEFEYAHMTEDSVNAVPGLQTGMANIIVQTPTKGFQVYGTTGGGLFRESLRDVTTTSFGSNVGGGVKISLMGPFRLRLDYRVYQLKGDPLYSDPKRFYAGVNFSF